jgi:hypothetical protein
VLLARLFCRQIQPQSDNTLANARGYSIRLARSILTVAIGVDSSVAAAFGMAGWP